MATSGDNNDNENAEAFDEDLLVEEGADDIDVATLFPPDHYEAVFDADAGLDGEIDLDELAAIDVAPDDGSSS